MTDSYIEINNGRATSFVGPDATALFAAITLKHGLIMLSKGIKPARHWTKTKALMACKQYTNKSYKLSQIELAIFDMNTWIEAMKCTIPVSVR
jgi:hypothetical protein